MNVRGWLLEARGVIQVCVWCLLDVNALLLLSAALAIIVVRSVGVVGSQL